MLCCAYLEGNTMAVVLLDVCLQVYRSQQLIVIGPHVYLY